MFQTVFVNTEDKPVNIKRLGQFTYCIRDNEMYLSELFELSYEHPNAPNDAIVKVYQFREVEYPYGSANLIQNAIEAVKAIGSITTLK